MQRKQCGIGLIDQGINPAEQRRQSVAVADAWSAYLADRRPHWTDVHDRDHVNKAWAGGEAYGRRTEKPATTKPGPLAALMPLALASLDAATVEQWAATEGNARPAVKSDVLTRERLKAWFAAVQATKNRTVAAALQVMLLTGARPGEVLGLRWEDLNTQWRGLTIRDKVEGERVIPLPPYVWHLLNPLPRGKGWVFASGWLEIPAGVVAQIQGHKPSATAEDASHLRAVAGSVPMR